MNDTREIPYSKREIDSHFQEVKQILGRIETQTIKTNGRVSSLEKWRSYSTGGLAIIIFIVIPLVVYIYQNSLHK